MRRRLLCALMLTLLAACPVLASPQAALAAATADIEAVAKRSTDLAYRTRYLARGPIPAKEWSETWVPKLLRAWANGLSREVEFSSFRIVGPDVVAVVLDDFRWSPDVWEKQRVEPYFHAWRWTWYDAGYEADGTAYEAGWYRVYRAPALLDAAQIKRLERLTGSRVPVVRADWWLFYSSRQIDLDNKERGFGYLDWLGVKKRDNFEALRAVDRKTSIKLGLEIRAVLEEGASGVAQKDRQIEWFATYGDGDYWLTLDTDDTSHGNLAVATLKPGQFKFKAQEGYITLPNDLWAFWLGNQKGEKQATAPDFIGPNDSPLRKGRDGRIHYASCLHCHVEGGLKPIDDWFRRTIRPPLGIGEADYASFLRTRRQYASDLDARLDKGRRRYTEALKRCADLDPAGFARIHADAYYGYGLRRRTRADVAEELGITEERLLRSLQAHAKKHGGAFPQEEAGLAPFLAEPVPGTLSVKYTEDLFQVLADIVGECGK